MDSSFNFDFDCISRIHRAWTATEMAHAYTFGLDHYFRITQRLHIFPVDAQTERPTDVRSVKSSQPAYRARVRLMTCYTACCPTQIFSSLVREAGRKPVPCFPGMNVEVNSCRIPTPLPNLLFRRKYSDQPKRHHSSEVRNTKHFVQVR